MSDRFATTITIGGTITAKKLKELYEACKSEGVGFDWTEDLGELEDFITRIKTDGNLTVDDVEVAGGEFEDLEEFCRDNNLSYLRHSDAKYEYDAVLAWWLPGMKQPKTCLSSQEQHALIHVDAIKEMLAKGTYAEKVSRIEAYLAAETPPDIPALTIITK